MFITDLPRTIKDAFQITRKLGIRYLWVDTLALSKAKLDWQQHSAIMGPRELSTVTSIPASRDAPCHETNL
jgi:hypothetical protein